MAEDKKNNTETSLCQPSALKSNVLKDFESEGSDMLSYAGDSTISTLVLGMGYSSVSQIGTNTFCVNQTNIIKSGQPTSVIKFGNTMDFHQMQNDLGVNGDLSINKDKFSVNIKGNYLKNHQDNGYSIGYNFLYKLELPVRTIEIREHGVEALNSFGKAVYADGHSLEKFKKICGDKFAVQENLGARLFVTLNINFSNKNDKLTFGGSFDGTIADLGSLAGSLKYVNDEKKISGSITLSAIQEGGQVEKLSKIFGEGKKNNIMSCGFGEELGGIASKNTSLDACIEMISDVITYAKSDFVNQLKEEGEKGGVITSTASSLGYTYLDYASIGISEENIMPQDVLKARRDMGTLLDTLLKQKVQINKFLSNKDVTDMIQYPDGARGLSDRPYSWSGKWSWNSKYIYQFTAQKIAKLEVSITNLLDRLQSQTLGVLQCFKNSDLCVEMKNDVNAQHETFKSNVNDILGNLGKAYALIANCKTNNNTEEFGNRILFPTGKAVICDDKVLDKCVLKNENGKKFMEYLEISEFCNKNPWSKKDCEPGKTSKLVNKYLINDKDTTMHLCAMSAKDGDWYESEEKQGCKSFDKKSGGEFYRFPPFSKDTDSNSDHDHAYCKLICPSDDIIGNYTLNHFVIYEIDTPI